MKNDETLVGLKCMAGEEILCKDCAFSKLEGRGFACKKNTAREAIALINSLQRDLEVMCLRVVGQKHALFEQQVYTAKLQSELKTAKAEAIKEFAEKLKEHSRKMLSSDFSGEFWNKAVLVETIDILVKEMTEKGGEV